MAININSNLIADQSVASVFNQKTGIRDVIAEKKLLDDPGRAVPEVAGGGEVRADEATLLSLDAERENQGEGQNGGNRDGNSGNASLDTPDRNTQKALTAYRNVALADRRSEIASLVGVDIFV